MAQQVLAPPRPKAYDDTFFKPISLWLTTTDHKLIGIMYMVTGVLSFVVAGVFALIMRIQLSQPNLHVVDPETYNQLVSSHGVTMIFFFVTVFLTGIANYIVPIMVGARDMAFPRLNLLGFWLIPVSIFIYYSGFFTGGVLNAGWTGYPPLTEIKFNPGSGVDLWILSLAVWGVSGIMASTNFLTTIVALRAPGMKLTRLPLFVWAQISTSILLLIVGSPLVAVLVLLEFDRQFGTNFFTTAGRPVLYQHLFWFFGHPEVYIMILPGFGMISEIIPVFSKKPIFGYSSMVAALFGIVFLSMAVWAHHMFTVGMNIYVETFFMVMTMLIAVPTGIKFFNWIATAWQGSVEFTLPIGFNGTFLVMHTLGLEGMPRRIVTYNGGFGEEGWGTVNMIITVASFLVAFSVLIFLINIIWSNRHGEIAGDDPWEGNTLEWATTSPPPPYNFERVALVRSFMPMREIRAERQGRTAVADVDPTPSPTPP